MKKHNFVKISSNICLTGNIQLILMSVIIYVNIQKFVDLWIFIYHISIESFEGNFQLIFFSLTSAFLKLLKENYFSRILSLIFFFRVSFFTFFQFEIPPTKIHPHCNQNFLHIFNKKNLFLSFCHILFQIGFFSNILLSTFFDAILSALSPWFGLRFLQKYKGSQITRLMKIFKF